MIICHINCLFYPNLTIIWGKQQNIFMLLLSVTKKLPVLIKLTQTDDVAAST